MDLTIRTATLDDAPAIAQVHVRAWQWAYRGLMPDALLDGLSVAERAERWRAQLDPAGEDRMIHVAETGGKLIGLVAAGAAEDLTLAPETGEIFALYVEPAVVGQGVGRALHDRAVDGLRERGFTGGVLWVLEANERGRRFYGRAGWAPDGIAKESTRGGQVRRELRYCRSFLHPQPAGARIPL